jgi:hypothetical protein
MMRFPWSELGHKGMKLKRMYAVDKARTGVDEEMDFLSRKHHSSSSLSSNGVFDEAFETRTLERMIQTQRGRDMRETHA